MKQWTQCPACKGLGKIDGKVCARCKGRLCVEADDDCAIAQKGE